MSSEETNDFSVLCSIGSTELPDDLPKYAKTGVPRKVSRLLERAFYAPFAAAMELTNEAKGIDDSIDVERF
ncbi:MAG TPA: hypothetical protein VHZ97_00070, partial [Pseudonocardiaceae bacterium]|nr:hypothetical protein [Pseudonocardiaceae bacterium]